MKRRSRNDGTNRARQRLIDAAVQHAERVTQGTETVRPVIFKPSSSLPTPVRKVVWTPKRKAAAKPERQDAERSKNSAIEDALRGALGMPPAQPENSPSTSKSKKNAAHPAHKPTPAANSSTTASAPAIKRTKPRKPKRQAVASAATPALPKRKKVKASKATAGKAGRGKITLAAEMSADMRRLVAERNGEARRELNARMRAAAPASTERASPFDQLRQRWLAEFSYIQRFQDVDSGAPDVLAAIARLEAIEAEWVERQGLAPDHPDYFPWPSTEAVLGVGNLIGGWEEIGMLAYLGYHVGITSELSAAQRHRLLSQVFSMRLPPLNSLSYMRTWAWPQSGPRLRRMAEAIAAFTRNAKRRKNPNLAEAIAQWEADLKFLRATFYVGHFDFPWPTV